MDFDPAVRPEHVVHKGFRPFVEGTEPLKQKHGRSWKFHGAVTLALVALAIFLNRALFAWEFGWTESFPVFMIIILMPFIAFIWAVITWAAFRERGSPERPSHVLLGVVSKRGRANNNNGMRNFTVEYRQPSGPPGKFVTPQVGNALNVGQQVAVLYYDDKKASIL